MTKDELINEIFKLGINLSDEQINKLEIYKDYLIKYNKHTNLTRIDDEENIFLKHFYDSLTIIKYINLNNYKKLLDLGSGAGFPGVVLKIVYPFLDVTVLESNNKKTIFLNKLKEKLNIDYNIIHDRAEHYILENRESYDIVVSRAMANLSVLLELSIPFVKIDGYFVAMKGNALEELKNSKNVEIKLGAKIESINKFELIKEKSQRTIILYKKVNKTKDIYPRKYEKIIKKPL